MKKTLTILCAVLLIAFLLVPVVYEADDGGSVFYVAPLYSVTLQRTMDYQNGVSGCLTGTVVRVLFFEVYDDVVFTPECGAMELPVPGGIQTDKT